MLKSIKIHENAYKDVKELMNILEKKKLIKGLYNVTLSTAIGYAIKTTLEDIKKKKKLLSLAGSWKDIDKNLVKEIYKGRNKIN